MKTKPIISFVLLLALTVISAGIGEIYFNLSDHTSASVLMASIVMLLVILKGQQIVDIFMELKDAPVFWRRLLHSYIVLIPTLLFLIYWLM